MVRIAIVEDELDYIDILTDYLKQYEKEFGEVFELHTFTDGDQIVCRYKPEYDIILMDVEMKFMDGMSAAEEIRKADSEVTIIFITNMAQYAIKGYAVDALDYVLKPISYFAFSRVLKKAISRLKKEDSHIITVNIRGGSMRMKLSDVFYIESQGHTLVFHTASGIYEATGTMKDIEAELLPYHFFRGNKGYLINLAHVDGMKENAAVVHGEELIVSRGRKREFMEALTTFWG